MHITIVAPVDSKLNTGNRMTARRWARMLKALGHQTEIANEFSDQTHQTPDVLIALHARRSAKSIRDFRKRFPNRPIVLAMTGTDLYRDIKSNTHARESLEIADRLILLQRHGLNELPNRLHAKCRVIYQSAKPPTTIPKPISRYFEVCVVGNLRPVKDPFRAAVASRKLPETSKIRIVHLGAALTPKMQKQAEAEMSVNPRYKWLGSIPHWQAMQRLARSRCMVLSSKLEGGAHVVTEAVVAGVPVISSRISGSIGLLGKNHPGYFEVGNTTELTELLIRVETDSMFYAALKKKSRAAKKLFLPATEQNSLYDLLSGCGV